MSLTLEQKQAVVAELAAVAAVAPSAVVVEYAGLNVAAMTDLRRSARAAGVYLKVVRNTLARRALKETSFEPLCAELTGPLLLAFSREEPGAAAKVVREFAKDHEQLVVRRVALDGQLHDPAALEQVADLPSLDQARATLLGLMQAPQSKLLRVLTEPQAKFARMLSAYHDQQQAA